MGEKKLQILEGLGYVAAIMIAVGGITDIRALRYFNVLGLVFAIIVIVRLMSMNIAISQIAQTYNPSVNDESGISDTDTKI